MALNCCLISRAIAAERFQVSAIDCSFLPKSGKATYGVDRFYNGKASRAEPGLEISTIAVVDVGASMAYAQGHFILDSGNEFVGLQPL